MKCSPYRHLLDDVQYRRWVENIERGSIANASECYRRVGHICKNFVTTPAELAQMDVKTATNFLLDIISHFESKNSAGTNIEKYVMALKSWWSFNDIEITKRIRIAGANHNTKYENERVPTQEELAKILDVADIRAKVALTLVAFCGFRIHVLGDFLGRDGLKVRDIPEMRINNDTVEFETVPTIVIVRRNLSKAGHQYSIFLAKQGCDYLAQYLEQRIREGQKITSDSPIITAHDSNPWKVGRHIRSTNVGDLMRKAIRNAGFEWRPYVFRRYFDTRLMVAESEGLVIRDWRVFWMGHTGDIEHVYTVNKGLPPDIVERMRASYAKGSKNLVTSGNGTSSHDRVLETFNLQFLTIAGYTKEEIEKFGDLSKFSVEQIQELLKKKSAEALGLNGNRQKVVSMQEVKGWLNQGWEFVSPLPPDEAIIKLPVL